MQVLLFILYKIHEISENIHIMIYDKLEAQGSFSVVRLSVRLSTLNIFNFSPRTTEPISTSRLYGWKIADTA